MELAAMPNNRFYFSLALAAFFLIPACSAGNGSEYKSVQDEMNRIMLEQRLLETRLSLAEDQLISMQPAEDAPDAKPPYGELVPESAGATGTVSPADGNTAEASPRFVLPVREVERKAVPPSSIGGETGAYRAALDALQSGKYKEAETAFKNFISRYGRSDLLPNAGYWLGEVYYSRRQYDEAILAFQDVVTKYPRHDKAAAALLKTGYSYERLEDKPNARFYLQQLLQDYPRSEPAALGKAALERLR
jgi:tol-pal system protein YbgF